ncbi:MAG: J domain-containing protein [Burkholderiales bacterium]|jgi:curved DNA-binding protein CbpA|uniref:J domain-containing protein n=1 Tax=Limnobacter sp. TaxID=2003368 RepID=UPI0039BC9503|nr:J domain-containing protein [Burkholderiales bacterium]
MQEVTFYEILEVSPNASQAVIRAAYKSLIQRYHPDKNSGSLDMEQKTILIGKAFEVLSDPEARKAYDQYLEQQLSNAIGEQKPHDAAEDGAESAPVSPPTLYQPAFSTGTTPASLIAWIVGGIAAALFFLAILANSSSLQHMLTQDERPQQTMQTKPSDMDWAAAEQKRQADAEQNEAESRVARTIPELALGITVKMPPSKDGIRHCSEFTICTHYIKIPTLGVIVHKNDAERIMQHILKNRALTVDGIKTKLSQHQYTELTQVDGEATLKKIILEQINMAIVGYHNYGVRDASQRKGVEEVLLPDSFSVH